MKFCSGLFGLLFSVAFVAAVMRDDYDIHEKDCGVPCGYTPPGQRPCCFSSSLNPPPVVPPCNLRSTYYCPCDCVSSSTTVCPPPDVPVPPCPVYCCESSSSSSSSCQPCPWRRVPVPRPFLACKSSSSSSSSDCGCVQACRRRQYYGRFHKAAVAEAGELTGQQVYEKFQNAQAVAAARDSCSSDSHLICDKKKALHTVFELDKKFVKYVNQGNLPALYKLITPNSRYAMNQPDADAPGCIRVTGPLSQYLPDYIGFQLTTVFQDIVYNPDQTVTIHVLDVLTNGTSTLNVEDVWRTYKSYQACNYKIDYLNGSNWICK